jgi:hypothetical protein
LKGWIEGIYLLKAKPDFSLDVLKKYVEVLNAIYSHYKEKLSTTPVPEVRVAKSMLYLLSRSSPKVPGASAEGFVEPASSTWTRPGSSMK